MITVTCANQFRPVFNNTHSGACVHNDVTMHVCGECDCIASTEARADAATVPGLPFGGVGSSRNAYVPHM